MTGAQCVLSVVSLWELRLKWGSFGPTGIRKGPVDPLVVLGFAQIVNWEVLPLTADQATAVLREPLAHRDPFDELLLIQAQHEGICLLTRDALLLRHTLSAGAEA